VFHLCILLVAAFDARSLFAQAQQVDEKELRDWADRGDADAQFELGLRMITGEGVKKNLAEGVKSIEMAAKQKHLRAQHILGTLHEDGVGVKKDLAKAAEWYRTSADLGFALSQHSLAALYEEGKGVKKDPAKAAEWFKKAAEQGHPPSQTAYASKLERGDGVSEKHRQGRAVVSEGRPAGLCAGHDTSRQHVLHRPGRAGGLPPRGRLVPARRPLRRSLGLEQSRLVPRHLPGGEPPQWRDRRAPRPPRLEARRRVAQSDEQPYEMIDTMAAALARNGEYKEAELWQQRSLVMLKEDSDLPQDDRQKLKT
jgi:hypothetical protein